MQRPQARRKKCYACTSREGYPGHSLKLKAEEEAPKAGAEEAPKPKALELAGAPKAGADVAPNAGADAAPKLPAARSKPKAELSSYWMG